MVGRLTGRLRGVGGAAPAAVMCHASSSPARSVSVRTARRREQRYSLVRKDIPFPLAGRSHMHVTRITRKRP
eukprot:1627360-Prymnesium_polylepis.1